MSRRICLNEEHPGKRHPGALWDFRLNKMSSSFLWLSCRHYHLKGFDFPKWRPKFLTSEMSVADVGNNRQSAHVSITVFLDVLLILAVKTTRQLRNKCNALLTCLEKLTLWLVHRDNHSYLRFWTNYRLTGSTSSHQIFVSFLKLQYTSFRLSLCARFSIWCW